MYKVKLKKPRYTDFDLIIIGSGAGGGVAAHIAAGLGKKVAIIEADTVGGECPNYGCVPTKALLSAAETYKTAKESLKFGVRTSGVTFNYPSIKAWKDQAVFNTGTTEGKQAFAHEGITLIKGKAHFVSPWSVSVGNQRYSAEKFLIATGTKNFIPPVEGLKEAGYLTYREAINLTKLPKSLFIIGGGAIGMEFAHLFNTFGVKVTMAEFAPRIAGKEDAEVGELMAAVFERDGIAVHTSAKVIKVVINAGYKTVYFEKNGETHQVKVEEILVASGKIPNTDLGLENAGVHYTPRLIPTNDEMATNVKHIFATGDVTGPYMFTHMASYQSRIAANNMFHHNKVHATYHAVPRCIFVDPEAACVGMTEQEAKDRKIAYQVGMVPISVFGRANTTKQDTGFVKVIASHTGVLIGASIVAPRAGEMIHELTLAIQHGMKASAIVDTIHAFPTWSEAVRSACSRIKCL